MRHIVHRGNVATIFTKMTVGDTFHLPGTIPLDEANALAAAAGLRLEKQSAGVYVVGKLPRVKVKVPFLRYIRHFGTVSAVNFIY